VRRALVLTLLCLAAPSSAWATDCSPSPDFVPERRAIERLTPSLLVGWTFDRSPSSYVGFELAYSHQYQGTFGGYAHALLLSDPDAASRRGQLGIGGIGGPWYAPVPDQCSDSFFVDPRPLARLGYAWRAGNLEANDTSFVQAGVSASAILGLMFSLAIPVTGGRSHSLQPNLAITLSAPVIIGR
jgi:hypothetical protein